MTARHLKRLFYKRIFSLLMMLLLSAGLFQTGSGSEYPPHYLSENESRYESYIAKNPDLPLDIAIAYVNAGVDKVFYSDVAAIADPGNTLVFCAKNSALPSDFVPEELINVSGSQKMQADAALHYLEMSDDARLAGLNFVVYSAYRSYASQESVYWRYVSGNGSAADNYSARPGHSEHQTGLAVDILHKYGSSGFRSARFQNTAEYKWLTQNAYKYGFILRYPEGYQSITGYIFEPWHWRYVGVRAATVMFYEKISTFEEYYGRYLAPGLSQNTAAEPVIPVNYTVSVNGRAFVCESYNTGSVNLFKIRDIAFLLHHAELSFDIGWDDVTGTVIIIPGAPYNTAGTELSSINKPWSPVPSGTTVLLGGESTGITVYTLDGTSFVDIHEFSDIIGFSVSINGDCIEIGGAIT